MRGFLFWQRWLLAVCVLIVAFGAALALLHRTAAFDAAINQPLQAAIWGIEPMDAQTLRYQSWVYGVLGATLCGWGIFAAFLAQNAFRHKELWAWNAIGMGVAVWYFLDTALSWLYAVYFNVIFNSAILILFALPLLFTRRHFEQPPS